MKRKSFYIGLGLLVLFIIWTVALQFVDVGAIGPQGSIVGFALLNKIVHNITGVHMSLYTITDWLGLVPICFIMGFGILGLCQWIKRKNLFKVDLSILALGGFYIVVMALYIFFEMFVVNYRPILINGILEASYPSSTTMLVMCVMPTAIMQFNSRIKNNGFKKCVNILILAFITFMVIGRLISGVHWFSDIIGGALLSCGLVLIYHSIQLSGGNKMNFELLPITENDIKQFKTDIQEAFQKGFEDVYGKTDDIILPEKDIDRSLNAEGAVAYKAIVNGEFLGGAVVVIDDKTQHNHLDLLYVKYGTQTKGVGYQIWNTIEKLHPDTKVWETCTPYFEKRNVHFYVNKCGFHIVEFLNEKNPGKDTPEDFIGDGGEGMFVFKKEMK